MFDVQPLGSDGLPHRASFFLRWPLRHLSLQYFLFSEKSPLPQFGHLPVERTSGTGVPSLGPIGAGSQKGSMSPLTGPSLFFDNGMPFILYHALPMSTKAMKEYIPTEKKNNICLNVGSRYRSSIFDRYICRNG